MKIWILMFALVSQMAWADKPIELRTSIWPPYQVMLQGELSGVAMATLTCIFNHLDERLNVEVMPWGRAIDDLNSRQADGLFTSIYSEELSVGAVMSSPFALEKWYVFTRSEGVGSVGVFPMTTRFSAVRSSSQSQWLRTQGFKNVEEVNEGEQLLMLLAAHRIDAFIADARYYDELTTQYYRTMKEPLPDFYRRFLRYTPLGVYFSKDFLAEYPTFIDGFNSHVAECADAPLSLSASEEQIIRHVFERRLRPLLSNREVVRALTKQNRLNASLDQAMKYKLDQTWRNERQGKEQPFIDDLLGRPVSVIFKAIQDTSDNLFTEIFLVDRYGLNVAQSVVTTDYDQSDEDAYGETVAKMSKHLFIDKIQFDDSAMKFHVQVSSAIHDEQDTLIGMLTVGINVEEALRQDQQY